MPMASKLLPFFAPNAAADASKKFEVIPVLVDQAVATRCNDEADELARSLHAVIALLDGHRTDRGLPGN